MKVSMFMKEEMHADQAEFRLLVLISKYARDPWRMSLKSRTGAEANGEWGAFAPSISPIQQKCHANVRPWDAQSCRPKGRCFPFTPSWKIAVEGGFILRDSNWNLFQVGYPVYTHTDINFLPRVSVTHRPALARSILGRWKERSPFTPKKHHQITTVYKWVDDYNQSHKEHRAKITVPTTNRWKHKP